MVMIGKRAISFAAVLAVVVCSADAFGDRPGRDELDILDEPGKVPTAAEDNSTLSSRSRWSFRTQRPAWHHRRRQRQSLSLPRVTRRSRHPLRHRRVGRDGFRWSGLLNISRKQEWPVDWRPPPEMIERQPSAALHGGRPR